MTLGQQKHSNVQATYSELKQATSNNYLGDHEKLEFLKLIAQNENHNLDTNFETVEKCMIQKIKIFSLLQGINFSPSC